MERRSFLQIVGTAIGGAVIGKWLPAAAPAAAPATDGGHLVPPEFASELIRVLSIHVETEQLDVTVRGEKPTYVPGLRRWWGELELEARAMPKGGRALREVRAWLEGTKPIPIDVDGHGRRIRGEALARAWEHRQDRPEVVRVEFEGTGALTATIR